VWWNHLLYGQPPPGVDVRLSLDLDMQQKADELLGDHAGALVVVNAGNGEILALASHPTYDPTRLEEIWSDLVNDTKTPLLNRALQGQYHPGTALGPFLLAALTAEGGITQVPEIELSGNLEAGLDCATPPADTSWAEVVAAGCTLPQITLSQELGDDALLKLFDDLGLFTAPNVDQNYQQSSAPPIIRFPEEVISGQSEFWVSPLQMALAAATLSTGGSQPWPQLVSAVKIPETGWTIFPPTGEVKQVFSQPNADRIAVLLADDNSPFWQIVARTPNEADQVITWYLAGTLPTWKSAPLSLVIILEEDNPEEALAIGQAMMEAALKVE
jgi:cell division protein FtsI/penicillin-binding protein 2